MREDERDEAAELVPALARVEAGGALPILLRMLSRSASSEPVPRALLRPLLLPASFRMSTYEPLVGVPDVRLDEREVLAGRVVLPERGVLLPVDDAGGTREGGRRVVLCTRRPLEVRQFDLNADWQVGEGERAPLK